MFYGPNERGQRILASALDIVKQLFGRVFHADNLITLDRCMGFYDDDAFVAALRANASNEQEVSLAWRLHTLTWAASECLNVPGDFVECGVYRGFCSNVVMDYLGFAGLERRYWLFDTFAGTPESDGPVPIGTYGDDGLLEAVRSRFAHFANVRIVPGRVPQSLAEAALDRIAFLHLDMNSAKAELGALEVLFDKLSPGGMLVLDDYGWHAYRQQKLVEDPWFAARGHRVLELPTGQGLVVKHAHPARGEATGNP